LAVSKLSFESKENDPAGVVSATATPLFGTVPLSQPWASVVISTRTNWFTVAVVTAICFPPVAEIPGTGAGVL
jgi:hypothetical protein